jgi:hypothetical protein
MIAPLTVADFSSLVDHPFAVSVGKERLTLSLMEATELKASRPDVRAAFSLLFRGPAAQMIPQGTYEFAHPSLGPVSIFIVPVGADANGVRYQAIFN